MRLESMGEVATLRRWARAIYAERARWPELLVVASADPAAPLRFEARPDELPRPAKHHVWFRHADDDTARSMNCVAFARSLNMRL